MYFYELPEGTVFEDFVGDLGLKTPEGKLDLYIDAEDGTISETDYDSDYRVLRVLTFVDPLHWVTDTAQECKWEIGMMGAAEDRIVSWFNAQSVKPTESDTSTQLLRGGLLKAITALDKYPEQRVLKSELLRLLLDTDGA